MKRYLPYLLLFALFAGAVGFVVMRYNAKTSEKAKAFYAIKERSGALAALPEWVSIRNNAGILLERIKNDPADTKSLLALAALYIQEARITGDHLYYDKAAMKYANDVLKLQPASFDALVYKSLLYMSQHHFAEGLATAQQAQKVNPYNAFVYGMMVDGYVELGNYDSAVANADRMVSIRPDLRSYSRISYLREIYGDYPGSIEAMKMAVDAGAPGDEATEWSRVQLGQLYEKTGDIPNAMMQYTISLDERPGYAYALAGLARIWEQKGDYEKAIGYYLSADSIINDYAFREELGDLYELTGRKEKAGQLYRDAVNKLSNDAQQGIDDQSIGHYADRELAYASLKLNENKKALEHAMMEYNRRPDNIDVNETVAWVLYRQKEYQKALPYIKMALKTNCRNPVLLMHAALIYHRAGDTAKARDLMAAAMKNKPIVSGLLQKEVGELPYK